MSYPLSDVVMIAHVRLGESGEETHERDFCIPPPSPASPITVLFHYSQYLCPSQYSFDIIHCKEMEYGLHRQDENRH